MVETKIVPSQPALILEGENRSLLISDLHIGFENSLESKEIFVGKNTTIQQTVAQIQQIIDSVKPDALIILGDVKSSIKSISKNEWNEVPLFFDKIKEKIETVLIPGNHDANIQRLIPERVTLVSSTGLVIENTLLTHGHTMPSENLSHVERIIMGHVHPVFFEEESILNGQRVWVSLKTKKENIFPSARGELELTIIPSFNRYFYATQKKYYKRSISPIVEKIKGFCSARVVTLDGTIIGNEDIIEQVL